MLKSLCAVVAPGRKGLIFCFLLLLYFDQNRVEMRFLDPGWLTLVSVRWGLMVCFLWLLFLGQFRLEMRFCEMYFLPTKLVEPCGGRLAGSVAGRFLDASTRLRRSECGGGFAGGAEGKACAGRSARSNFALRIVASTITADGSIF